MSKPHSSTLTTEGLGIRFGAFQAVGDVTLTLEPGARQALIGPNGERRMRRATQNTSSTIAKV